MEQILNLIEEIDNVTKCIISIDILLRNGNIVSAYRQGMQTVDLIKDLDKRKIMGRALLRIRKGEQIDALNDIKSLQDLLKNDKRKILTSILKNSKKEK